MASSRINTVEDRQGRQRDAVDHATGDHDPVALVLHRGGPARRHGRRLLRCDRDDVDAPGLGFAIKQAELFTPDGKGGGTWTPLATANQERTYHNTAILLPTGQVLVAGHAPIPAGYYKQMTLPGFENNIRDASLELFNPPYLSRGRPSGDPRPRPTAAWPTAARLTIPTADAASIKSVVLVRNPALTHLVDGDQRTVELPITSTDGGAVKVTPADQQGGAAAGAVHAVHQQGHRQGPDPVGRQPGVRGRAGAGVPGHAGCRRRSHGRVQGARTDASGRRSRAASCPPPAGSPGRACRGGAAAGCPARCAGSELGSR